MKSKATERNAVVETVEQLAQLAPQLTLMSQGRAVLHTTGKGLEDALANIFGPETIESMAEVSGDYGGIRICGFAGLPRCYRRTRDRQLFSVNQRPVKNTSLGWALDHAYAGLLPPKTYPVAVIDLSLEPGAIDVNVHPTKAEIRFGNESLIRRSITQSAKRCSSRGYLSEPEARHGQILCRQGQPASIPRQEERISKIIQGIRQMQ